MNKWFIIASLIAGLLTNCSTGKQPVRELKLSGLQHPARLYVTDQGIFVTHANDSTERAAELLHFKGADWRLIQRYAGLGTEAHQLQMIPGHSVYAAFPPGQVVVNGQGSVVRFDLNGTFLERQQVTGAMFQAWDDGFVGFHAFDDSSGVNQYALSWYDRNFARGTICYQLENQFHTVQRVNRVLTRDLEFDVGGSTLFAKGADADFVISAFNAGGELSHEIRLDYKRLPVTEAHRDDILDGYRLHPLFGRIFDRIRKEIVFPELLPAIRTIKADDSYVYAQTYDRKSGKTEFIILTHAGLEVKRVRVDFSWKSLLENHPYDVWNGTLYQLVPDESEQGWLLRITDLMQ